jgi:hypothetical protein
VLPRAAGRQPGSARQRGALTDHGNSAAAPQVHVRHAWQQGGDPPIGSNGAVHGMPAGAAAGRHAHCNLWSARAHSRHTCATVLPATIDGIRAHFGNPTQITLLRMPASAGSPHEKTVHNGGSRVLTVTSDRDAALPLLKSVSELIADYFRARVPGRRCLHCRQICPLCTCLNWLLMTCAGRSRL